MCPGETGSSSFFIDPEDRPHHPGRPHNAPFPRVSPAGQALRVVQVALVVQPGAVRRSMLFLATGFNTDGTEKTRRATEGEGRVAGASSGRL